MKDLLNTSNDEGKLFAFEINYIKKIFTAPGLVWDPKISTGQMISTVLQDEDANQFAKQLQNSVSFKNSAAIIVCKSSKSTRDCPLWRVVIKLKNLDTISIKKNMAKILNEIHDPGGKKGWSYDRSVLSFVGFPTMFVDTDSPEQDPTNEMLSRISFSKDFCIKANKYGWNAEMIQKFKESISCAHHHKCDEYIVDKEFMPQLFNMLSIYQNTKYQSFAHTLVQNLLLPSKLPQDVVCFISSFFSNKEGGRLAQLSKATAAIGRKEKEKIDENHTEQEKELIMTTQI